MKLEKKTLNLREGDWDRISEVYKDQQGIATSVVVRTLISRFVEQTLPRVQQTDTLDININLEGDTDVDS
jgi:hypothetical protein